MKPRRRSRKTSGHKNGGITIDDVARKTGFSLMTVSRVINAEGNVKASTRDRIQNAIDEMGYSPNIAARSLAGGNQRRIALIYRNPSAAYLSRILVGSLETARELNAQLVVENCEEGQHLQKAIKRLYASGVEGVILTPPLSDDESVLEFLAQEGRPFAVIANWKPDGDMILVHIDDRAAVKSMIEHLVDLGHQRIAFISGTADHKASLQREEGYRAALMEKGQAIDENLIVQGAFTFRSGLESAAQLMALDNPPSAIFAANDDMAAGAVTALHRMHIDVPGQVSVCGFDDTDFATSIWPELTTIHQPISAMATEATKLLLSEIKLCLNNKPSGRVERQLDVKFQKRGSHSSVEKINPKF